MSLAQKDAQLAQLTQAKAALEARLGWPPGKEGSVSSVAGVTAQHGLEYVPRDQHEELELELAAVKEQLLECLEELSARERELSEVRSVKLVLLCTGRSHSPELELLCTV